MSAEQESYPPCCLAAATARALPPTTAPTLLQVDPALHVLGLVQLAPLAFTLHLDLRESSTRHGTQPPLSPQAHAPSNARLGAQHTSDRSTPSPCSESDAHRIPPAIYKSSNLPQPTFMSQSVQEQVANLFPAPSSPSSRSQAEWRSSVAASPSPPFTLQAAAPGMASTHLVARMVM